MSLPPSAVRFPAFLALGFVVLGALPGHGQVPPCGANGRHYNPDEVLVAPAGSGRLFFVDGVNGNDANDGLSEATAFRTISRAVSGSTAPIAPGDTVRIKAGLYRERPFIRKSGTAAARIVVGPFGNGPVVVDASTAVTGWTLQSGQVYQATPGFAVRTVVVDGVPLFPEFSLAAMAEGRFYYDSASGRLYVWCPGGGSPAARDVGVIRNDEAQEAVRLDNAHYVTLYGLTVRFSGGHGVNILGNHARVEKSRLVFNGKSGVSFFGYGSTSSTGGQVIKNYVHHNMIRNWPRGMYKWGGWAGGVGSNGTPNLLVQGNIVHKNGGEGVVAYLGSGGTVVRDNIVYDNWSVNVYIDNQPNVVVESNYLYSRAPNPGDLYNNGDPEPGDGRNLRRLRPEGIMTADENYGTSPPATLNNVTIANNLIVHCRRGLTHYGAATGSGLKNVRVLNNTVVAAATLLPQEGPITGITIPYNSGNNVGSVYRNNVVYATHPSTYVLYAEDVPNQPEKFLGLTLEHNLWFHTTRTAPFHWGPSYSSTYDYTHAQWLALSGTVHGTNDIYAHPQLLDPTLPGDPYDLKLGPSSPARDAGHGAGAALDYDFCPRPQGVAHDMSGFEAGSAPPPPPLAVFEDDFESGGYLRWTQAVHDSGDLAVTQAAALEGTVWGLSATVDDRAALYVRDDTPTNERTYAARFAFDPNGYDPGEAGGSHTTRIFALHHSDSVRVAELILRRDAGIYSLVARARRDNGAYVATARLEIADAPHVVELQWRRATAVGANDGRLEVLIDGSPAATLSGIANYRRTVSHVRLGVAAVGSGASGALYFDEFSSRRLVPLQAEEAELPEDEFSSRLP